MVGREVFRDSEPRLGNVFPNDPAATAGLQSGDLITAVDGEKVDEFDDFRLAMNMSPSKPVRVDYVRNGKAGSVIVTPKRVETEYGVAGRVGASQYLPSEIGRVEPDTAAAVAGFRGGDVVQAVEGHPVRFWDDVLSILDKQRKKPLAFTVKRGEAIVNLTLAPPTGQEKIYPGFIPPTRMQKFAFGEAFRESLDQNVKMVRYTFATLGRLVKFQGSAKDFSGPLSIARISGEMLRSGWKDLMYLMASISLQLGILNLLPIPVLDGGHIFVLLIEGAAGRELSVRVKERITQIGFAVLATLMLVVLCNDVIQNVMRMMAKNS
jgi:regulator of sigma E protease